MAEENSQLVLTIAILGGTGKEGAGLSMRWALNGYRVIIGSRSAEKAITRAGEMNEELGGDYIIGMSNEDAAKEANLIVVSVPYDAHEATLESVKEYCAGKIVVDLTVALQPPDVMSVNLPEGQASAIEAQYILGDDAKVVAAFQNVSSVKLKKIDEPVDCDVLVCGEDPSAKQEVIQLVHAAGMRGIDAGGLKNAIAVEALTPVLLYINKAYKVKGAGIRITGVES